MSLLEATSFENLGSVPSSPYLPYGFVGTGTGLSTRSDLGAKSGAKALTGNGFYMIQPGDRTDRLQVLGWVNRMDVVAADFFSLYGDGQTTEHLVLRHDTTGKLFLDRGATNIASEAGTSLTEDTWVHVEIIARLHDTLGTVDVYIGGNPTPVIAFSGDTKNAGTETTFSAIRFTAPGGAFNTPIDDWVLINSAGSAPMNASQQLGACLVEPLNPTGDGALTGWTPSTGSSHFALIDEDTTNTADYNAATAVNTIDTYTYPDLSHANGTVYAVHMHAVAGKISSGPMNIRPVARIAGSNYTGTQEEAAFGESGSINHWLHGLTLDVNPATSNPWTVSEINAAEFGIEAL